ncbi:uncharacterized protein LOC143306051 [Osmia lignaria lignaria]|uniref:uncharacterized protein LOC143306051 n=1 Tax=Osmia lignaria lignaria TaxID=1437193 RepID=UPI00402B745F
MPSTRICTTSMESSQGGLPAQARQKWLRTAKSYRPISLTSFLLKTLERLVDRHVREHTLAKRPIHASQHAYQSGKSVETALHHLVREVEEALSKGKSVVSVFIDIEGAFDSTSFDVMNEAASSFGIDDSLITWLGNMLRTRTIITSSDGSSLRARIARGCPQGGVLSPLLWTLVVDGLLCRLSEEGFLVLGYADDICISVKSRHQHYIARRLQEALTLVQEWCLSHKLKVNPTKMEMVLFSRKRSFDFKAPHCTNGNCNILGLQKDVWNNVGTKTKNGQVDLHRNLSTPNNIRLRCMVDLHEETLQQEEPRKDISPSIAWDDWGFPHHTDHGNGDTHGPATTTYCGGSRGQVHSHGSKTKTGTGAGIWGEAQGGIVAVLGHVSILQAEVFATWACAKLNLERDYRDKHIYICSDSKAALGSLRATIVRSRLVQDCTDLLERLAGNNNRVNLIWVPGHAGILGNERANMLAREGARRPGPDTTYRIGVDRGTVKEMVREWARTQTYLTWNRTQGMRHAKAMFKGPSSRLGKTLSCLDRNQLRLLVGLITGHWYTRKHLMHLGTESEPGCPRCGEEDETPLHLIWRCKGLEALRRSSFGVPVLDDARVGDIGVGRLLGFAREAGLHNLPRY